MQVGASARRPPLPSLQVVGGTQGPEGGFPPGGSTRANPDEAKPLQDPGFSPELAGISITEAALRGTGWVLKGCLRAWECLGLGGRVS